MTDIKAPTFSESITEGTLLTWAVKEGDAVKSGDLLAEIETDKVILEVYAQASGTISKLLKAEGDTVLAEEVLGQMGEGAAQESAPAAASTEAPTAAHVTQDATLSPAVRRVVTEEKLDPASIAATGSRGNITKADALNAAAGKSAAPAATPVAANAAPLPTAGERIEERVPMTRIRQKIAERLKEVQNTTAMLTTFNEVDMQPIMDLRKKYQDAFVKKHGVKLGFMSFFVRASAEALKQFPVVNASVDGKDVIYHGYHDIGIAVSTDRGLVVPILRDADTLSLAEIEQGIIGYAQKAREGKLTLEDMQGGTFTITNGGTFGSMMSTPIINAPQSAILGMHNIIERPVAVKGQVVIRPMMYLALSYDHRIIDGRDSVQFLVTIKNLLEDPARLLLDL